MEPQEIDWGPDHGPFHCFWTKEGLPFSLQGATMCRGSQCPKLRWRCFTHARATSSRFYNNCCVRRDLRKGKYERSTIAAPEVLKQMAKLGYPPESAIVDGLTMLPQTSLETLLKDRYKGYLVPKLQNEVMRLLTKRVRDLLKEGQFEEALPSALETVKKGHDLYHPTAPQQLAPLYMLAAQVNLGMHRPVQTDELLAMASWHLIQDKSGHSKNVLRAETGRLFAGLALLQGHMESALKGFSEEAYYKSLEYGIFDVRTSLAFYNLYKAFVDMGNLSHGMAFGDTVIETWLAALQEAVLKVEVNKKNPWGKPQYFRHNQKPHDVQVAIAHLPMQQVCEMLQDIFGLRAEVDGEGHPRRAEEHFILGLLSISGNQKLAARQHLQVADSIYRACSNREMLDLVTKAIKLVV